MKNILIVDDAAGWLTYNKQNLSELYPDAKIYAFGSAREAYDLHLRLMEELILLLLICRWNQWKNLPVNGLLKI